MPLADMWSRRRIIATSMVLATIMTLVIATTQHICILWVASLVLGICSVVPQIFIPMARLYSRPEHKSQNMGIVLSGLLSGVLGARVLSGYIGDWFDWRTMFYIAAANMLVHHPARPATNATKLQRLLWRTDALHHKHIQAAPAYTSLLTTRRLCLWQHDGCMVVYGLSFGG